MSYRKPVNKRKSAKMFRRDIQKTKSANMAAVVNRGGIRL